MMMRSASLSDSEVFQVVHLSTSIYGVYELERPTVTVRLYDIQLWGFHLPAGPPAGGQVSRLG